MLANVKVEILVDATGNITMHLAGTIDKFQLAGLLQKASIRVLEDPPIKQSPILEARAFPAGFVPNGGG